MTQQALVREPRIITRLLPVQLTEQEMAQLARDIGQATKYLQDTEMQAKAASEQWKDRIRGAEARRNDLAMRAQTGQVDRDIECEERFDYRRHEVSVVRRDNGVSLEVRPMSEEERQPELPHVELPKTEAHSDPDSPPGDDDKPRHKSGGKNK